MPTVSIAHVREQGVDLIIVPLDHTFGMKTNVEQNAARNELQAVARAAKLAGTVCIVWDAGGRMGFLAPQNYAPFFRSLSLDAVQASVNRELTW
jgi:hypothetical protein